MCHGTVTVYSCRCRNVARIQLCPRARKPANHHGCWAAFRFWLTGATPRRKCGSSTAQRQYLAQPCFDCARKGPPRLAWEDAFVAPRAAPLPPPQRAAAVGYPSSGHPAWPLPAAVLAGPQRTRDAPAFPSPLSCSRRMAVQELRQQPQQQQQMLLKRYDQAPLVGLPMPAARSRHGAAGVARTSSLPPAHSLPRVYPSPPPQAGPRKLQKRRRPPMPEQPPRPAMAPPASMTKTRSKSLALQKGLRIDPTKANRLLHGLQQNLFCLVEPRQSEESLVCIDAKRIEERREHR